MSGFSVGERKVLSGFFQTIAAGWFGAGVITTTFIRPEKGEDLIYNLIVGIGLTLASLKIALGFSKKQKW